MKLFEGYQPEAKRTTPSSLARRQLAALRLLADRYGSKFRLLGGGPASGWPAFAVHGEGRIAVGRRSAFITQEPFLMELLYSHGKASSQSIVVVPTFDSLSNFSLITDVYVTDDDLMQRPRMMDDIIGGMVQHRIDTLTVVTLDRKTCFHHWIFDESLAISHCFPGSAPVGYSVQWKLQVPINGDMVDRNVKIPDDSGNIKDVIKE
jgi:hypothetical protein